MHKKAFDIQLQHITILRVVVWATSDEPFRSLYTKVSAFAGSAGIVVMDKASLKYWIQLSNNQVVHHTISEIGREYFSFYRLSDNKGNGFVGLITAVIDFVAKR